MSNGYAGKFLWVDLSTGAMSDETPDEALLRDFIGGYGVAARILYDRIPAGVDPLGPDNILAVLTGPLTASAAPTGTRWTVAAKSPLTQTWGDANGSGFFGPVLKLAGYDAVFFTGVSAQPVYLLIDDGQPALRDASELWGQDTYQIEDWLKETFGKKAEGICIGPAGEKQSLIAAIMHRKGRAAGRSGLGAVMGSKRLKAIVVRGNRDVQPANPEAAKALRNKFMKQITGGVGLANFYRSTGTPGYIEPGIMLADAPTRNWAGVGPRDFYPQAEKIGYDAITALDKVRKSCWRCPISCWGEVKTRFAGREVVAHVPEYETAIAFGSNLMNEDLPSIVTANEICNRLGLDAISAGATVAFAVECYEQGLLSHEDADGLDLSWGNAQAIVTALHKLALREPGLGELLADGVKVAAEKIGPEAQPFAIHVGGQELPMHDPRYEPGMGLIYHIDATPGRHTQGANWNWPEGLQVDASKFGQQPHQQEGQGKALRPIGNFNHIANVSGLCLFGYLSTYADFLPEFLTAVTGHAYDIDELLVIGERIAALRQAFNVREGYNPIANPIPERAYGLPPLEEGPTAGVTVELETLRRDYLDAMGWTQDAAIPTRKRLMDLGLDDVAADLWG